MKKLISSFIAIVAISLFHEVKATNNEVYIKPASTVNNEQISTNGDKQTKQYTFTLFDFFFSSDSKVKSDSAQTKEQTTVKEKLKIN